MAAKLHIVRRYCVSFDAGGGLGRLQLWGETGEEIAQIGFLEEGRRPPTARVAPDCGHGVGFLPQASMSALLDLLRHEAVVYVALENDPAASIRIHT
jgi:hypothetical protein